MPRYAARYARRRIFEQRERHAALRDYARRVYDMAFVDAAMLPCRRRRLTPQTPLSRRS